MSLLHRTTIVLSTMLLIAGCAAPESLSTPPEACPDANPGFITIVINSSFASLAAPPCQWTFAAARRNTVASRAACVRRMRRARC